MKIKSSFVNDKGLRVRFFTTLLANILRIGLSFIGGIIIARNLGPADYGNYAFLLGSFVSIMALIDMGTSSAFYTFLSQRKRSLQFYLYYFLWTLIQFLIVLVLIGIIFPETWRNRIWLGHTKGIIILAFVASFTMNKIWELVTHAGESVRATVIVQLYNISIAGLYVCVVLAMAFLRILTISNLFIIITLIYLLLSFVLTGRLREDLIVREKVRLIEVINEFKVYCAPLVIYSIASFFYLFSDIWLLQRFGGAVQQGFYSVGLRFSAICLIATTSMLKVFWKEIADVNQSGNKEHLHYLYTKTSRIFYFISAVGACFFIPFSRQILLFLLGPKYEAGWFCLAIMFLYPIHQSLGQINGTYFYATTQTKLRSKIGIITMIVSIPVTYVVLAPPSALIPGIGLGSVGLALKMVVLQIIGVNVLTYFICRLSGWRFDFLYQFGIIISLVSTSLVAKTFLIGFFHLLNIVVHPLILMASCIPFYVLAVGAIVFLFPQLCGLERRQITNLIGFLKGAFGGR